MSKKECKSTILNSPLSLTTYKDINTPELFVDNQEPLGELAGIQKPMFTHLGRHTFATTVTLSNGVSLESVAKMLGHSSIKHTQGYAKVVASKVKSEMKNVKQLFK